MQEATKSDARNRKPAVPSPLPAALVCCGILMVVYVAACTVDVIWELVRNLSK